MDAEGLVEIELDDTERHVLQWSLIDWGGAARCSDGMARAIGFASADDLREQTSRLDVALAEGRGLSGQDWTRVLLSAEVCFASDVMGSGIDWSTTSGLTDAETIAALRRIQRKLGGIVSPRWSR